MPKESSATPNLPTRSEPKPISDPKPSPTSAPPGPSDSPTSGCSPDPSAPSLPPSETPPKSTTDPGSPPSGRVTPDPIPPSSPTTTVPSSSTTAPSSSPPSSSSGPPRTSPRPGPGPGLVHDDNGPIRCREVAVEPGGGLHQQSDHGSHSCSSVIPGSYYGRIPCSSPNKQKPCLGALHRTWDYAKMHWTGAYPRSGWPEPWELPSAAFSSGPKILEIVDWQYQTSHYRILVDNMVADESDEEGYENESLQCDQPDMCSDKGFGHAFAFIPQASTSVIVENTGGKKGFNSGNEHARVPTPMGDVKACSTEPGYSSPCQCFLG